MRGDVVRRTASQETCMVDQTRNILYHVHSCEVMLSGCLIEDGCLESWNKRGITRSGIVAIRLLGYKLTASILYQIGFNFIS